MVERATLDPGVRGSSHTFGETFLFYFDRFFQAELSLHVFSTTIIAVGARIAMYNNSLITCQGRNRPTTYIGKAFHSVFWLSNYLTVVVGSWMGERISTQESQKGPGHLLLTWP